MLNSECCAEPVVWNLRKVYTEITVPKNAVPENNTGHAVRKTCIEQTVQKNVQERSTETTLKKSVQKLMHKKCYT